MPNLVAVVKFKVKEGTQTEAEKVFEQLVTASHGHDGCITYAMHKAKGDPTTYVLVERWESKEKADAHLQQPEMAEVGGKFGTFLDGAPELLFLEPLPFGDSAKGTLAGA